jgi:hypothetical protein
VNCEPIFVYNTSVMKNTMDEMTSPIGVEQFTDRFATAVSAATNPLFVAIPTLGIIALHTAPNTLQGLAWWGVVVVGISLAPLLFILRGVRLGRFSDRHVSIRQQRLVPLLFGISCVVAVFVILLLLHASRLLIMTIVALLVGLSIATAITKVWKISFHLIGVAGAVTVLVLVFGPIFLLLLPLLGVTAWARWRVQAHTILQACAGTVLAIVVTVGVFALFTLL